jgi:hypothetical protein
MKIESDKRLNQTLQRQVANGRSVMVEEADKNKLPSRFTVEPSTKSASMFITDTTTKKVTNVSLFAYGEVRKSLNDLFG